MPDIRSVASVLEPPNTPNECARDPTSVQAVVAALQQAQAGKGVKRGACYIEPEDLSKRQKCNGSSSIVPTTLPVNYSRDYLEETQNRGSNCTPNGGGEKRALDLSPGAQSNTHQLSPENKRRCVLDPMMASFSSSKHMELRMSQILKATAVWILDSPKLLNNPYTNRQVRPPVETCMISPGPSERDPSDRSGSHTPQSTRGESCNGTGGTANTSRTSTPRNPTPPRPTHVISLEAYKAEKAKSQQRLKKMLGMLFHVDENEESQSSKSGSVPQPTPTTSSTPAATSIDTVGTSTTLLLPQLHHQLDSTLDLLQELQLHPHQHQHRQPSTLDLQQYHRLLLLFSLDLQINLLQLLQHQAVHFHLVVLLVSLLVSVHQQARHSHHLALVQVLLLAKLQSHLQLQPQLHPLVLLQDRALVLCQQILKVLEHQQQIHQPLVQLQVRQHLYTKNHPFIWCTNNSTSSIWCNKQSSKHSFIWNCNKSTGIWGTCNKHPSFWLNYKYSGLWINCQSSCIWSTSNNCPSFGAPAPSFGSTATSATSLFGSSTGFGFGGAQGGGKATFGSSSTPNAKSTPFQFGQTAASPPSFGATPAAGGTAPPGGPVFQFGSANPPSFNAAMLITSFSPNLPCSDPQPNPPNEEEDNYCRCFIPSCCPCPLGRRGKEEFGRSSCQSAEVRSRSACGDPVTSTVRPKVSLVQDIY
ncbi:hypothetical protein C7M84_021702 [Penaeus vannamei]|uniref:Uncharacterized protein n=1 Tax=Penaeus vannamei TaxID=6689 RepID=A0A3R7Q3B6_PENVA|nr:hypothetical protein C7M84_021702 [Penaeus vannamei]